MAAELEKLATWNAFNRHKSNRQAASRPQKPHTYTAYNGVRVTGKRHAYDKEYLEQTRQIIKSRQEANV